MTAPFFQVIFRTCDVVNSVNKVPRPFGFDKKTLIKVCFKSLYDSLQGFPHHIYILGDKLSDEMLSFFSQFPVEVTNGDYGNDESIRQSIIKAVEYPDQHWVYFCEDDYLHRLETFQYITNFIQNKEAIIPKETPRKKKGFFTKPDPPSVSEANIFIHPPDYPDRYLPDDRKQSYIFLSDDCHWRQIANVTFTFMQKAGIVKKYRQIFETSATDANDAYLSEMLFCQNNFGHENICLSPVPGLSSHMHEGVMTPLVNWEAIINKYLAEI